MSQKKVAIITGITGMDGSILTDQLLEKEYKVFGLVRRTSRGTDLNNANHLVNEPNVEIIEGDLTDLSSIQRLCTLAQADYFFNFGAMSHVGTSFKEPVHTGNVTGIGVLNCLEAIRLSGIHTRFLQASTSEMYGGVSIKSANEKTAFYPKSPYGVSKLFGYWITRNYRESYKMFASNMICFNHEAHRRSDTFVTRKITKAVAAIKKGKQDKLYLGNLDAKRDWGWAPDYMKACQLILEEASQPDDFVVATGETHSVREFCKLAFEYVGLDYTKYVEIDPRFYRPCEVDVLVGDFSKIKNRLGWEPQTKFKELVEKMVDHDLGLYE